MDLYFFFVNHIAITIKNNIVFLIYNKEKNDKIEEIKKYINNYCDLKIVIKLNIDCITIKQSLINEFKKSHAWKNTINIFPGICIRDIILNN